MIYKMDGFKSSLFNTFGVINDKYIIANTFTGAIIIVDSNGFHAAHLLFENPNFTEDHKNEKLVKFLLENGYIIKKEVDEFDLLEKRFQKSRIGENILGIAIAVTLDCNFNCCYCYENKKSIYFLPDTQTKLFSFLKRELYARKELQVVWWGGEPLLNIELIEELTYKIVELCKSLHIKYSASIVTNGYLLDESRSDILHRCYVNTIQITIDGDPESHNNRRKLKDKGDTFFQIINNLLNNCKHFEKIIIRINADKNNVNGINKILEFLEPVKQNIMLCLRPTTAPNVNVHPCWLLTGEEFVNYEKDFFILAYQRGFKILFGINEPGTAFCNGYQYNNSFIIDPLGNVQICPVFTGDYKERYGYLKDDGKIELNANGEQFKWRLRDNPFIASECLNCHALPICMGGCLLAKNRTIKCLLKFNTAEKLFLRVIRDKKRDTCVI